MAYYVALEKYEPLKENHDQASVNRATNSC